MARKGFIVTAFDYTPEMISEGKKRFGGIHNLEFVVGDIRSISLEEKSFDFVFLTDLELIDNIDEIRSALLSLGAHMRSGGGLVLDMTLPSKFSWDSPMKVFHPRRPNFTDKKIWKESKNRYDAVTKRHYIDQVIFVEDESGIKKINHSLCLQYYERDEMIEALLECGFTIISESNGQEKESWKTGDSEWVVEAIKQ